MQSVCEVVGPAQKMASVQSVCEVVGPAQKMAFPTSFPLLILYKGYLGGTSRSQKYNKHRAPALSPNLACPENVPACPCLALCLPIACPVLAALWEPLRRFPVRPQFSPTHSGFSNPQPTGPSVPSFCLAFLSFPDNGLGGSPVGQTGFSEGGGQVVSAHCVCP